MPSENEHSIAELATPDTDGNVFPDSNPSAVSTSDDRIEAWNTTEQHGATVTGENAGSNGGDSYEQATTSDIYTDENQEITVETVQQETESVFSVTPEACFIGLNTILLILILLLQIYIILKLIQKKGQRLLENPEDKTDRHAELESIAYAAAEKATRNVELKFTDTQKSIHTKVPDRQDKREPNEIDGSSPASVVQPPPVSTKLRPQKEYDFSFGGYFSDTVERKNIGEGDFSFWSDGTVTVSLESEYIPADTFVSKGYTNLFNLKDTSGRPVYATKCSKIKILKSDPNFPAKVALEGNRPVVSQKGALIVVPSLKSTSSYPY